MDNKLLVRVVLTVIIAAAVVTLVTVLCIEAFVNYIDIPPDRVEGDNCDTASSFELDDRSGSASVKVWVTRAGDKYHATDCPHLDENARQLPLSIALAQGYEPCFDCTK